MTATLNFPPLPHSRSICSICEHPHVYFECADQWVEKVEFKGKVYLISQMEIKRYCKECFEEYGGDPNCYA